MWAGFGAYLGVLAAAPRLGRRLVWGIALLLVVAFAAVPPVLSHDVYSYVDYARLGVLHGLNPYVYPPSAAPADPAFADVAWTAASSAYGPLFTLGTYPLAWLPVGAAVATLKAVTGASLLALAALAARLAPARGVDPRRAAAFVALNPLALVHVVGGAHNDSLAMLAAMCGVAAALSARPASAGIGFVAALAVKAPAALAAPFAFLGVARRDADDPSPSGPAAPWSRRGPGLGGGGPFLLGALLALAAIALAGQIAFGPHWLDSFGLASENQSRTSHLSIPITTARLTGIDPDAARIAALALYAGLFILLLAWTYRGGDWLRAAAWASLGLLVASAWLLPWYLIWALPLAALSRDRPLQLLLLGLTAYQLGARIPL